MKNPLRATYLLGALSLFSLGLWTSWIVTPVRPQIVIAGPIATPELPDLVERVLPGVVNISSITVIENQVQGMEEFMRFWGIPSERKQTSLGSGFLVTMASDGPGFVITNNHVVDHATEVMVTLVDKRQFRARIVGKDQKLDLALLQLRDAKGGIPEKLSSVPLAETDKVRIAEPVFAVGNPFGLQHTVTLGIISAKNRTIGLGPFDGYLQTDASINPGNSGGPLFNMKGEVIGINTVIFSRTGQSAGLGFAIPAHDAKNALADLKRYGRIPRPWLGVIGEEINPQRAAYYGLPVKEGVLIYNMARGGPGHKAGLRQGDIIVGLEGPQASGKIESPLTLERLLMKHRPNETVTLKIQRANKKVDLKIPLEELPRLDQLPQGII